MNYNLCKQVLVKRLGLCFISILIGGLMLAVGWKWTAVVQAAGFTVNSTADAADANPGDGVCETAPSNSVCTLRAAIQEANASPGDDTITLPSGTYILTLSGADEDASATGDLDVTSNLTLNGSGASTTVITSSVADRLSHIIGTVTVTISGVTIGGGDVNGVGGGILNAGMLTISNAEVTSNAASSHGGGIYNTGTLTITASTITDNLAGSSAPGDGGGLYNASTVEVTDSTFSGNTGDSGGGINSDTGTLTIRNSSLISNTAAFFSGGGLRSRSTSTLVNSTVSGNMAAENGGGVRVTTGTTTLTDVTIVSNTASPAFQGGGLSISGTVNLRNTITANNTPVNCASSGTITDGGNNLDSGATCLFGSSTLTNTNPLLGPLQDNGGSTLTHALLAGSPAVDAGSNSVCAAAPVNGLDQRGITRPQGPSCDIGAYEVEYNDAPVNSVPGAQSTNEDTAKVFSSGGGNPISVSDIDAGSSPISVTLTATNGTLTLLGTSGLTFSVGDGTADATMTFTGTVTAINAALNGLSFAPTANYNGAASVQITTNDQGNTGLGGAQSDDDTVAITVAAMNDAPVNSVPGAQSTNEDTAKVFSSGGGNPISVSDIDAGSSPISVTLTATNGTLTLLGTSGLTFSVGDGTADATMTFTGTVTAINAALNGLSFAPTANYNGAASVQITTNDQGNTGLGGAQSDDDTVAITVAAMNDAPVNSVPGAQSTNEDTAKVFSSGGGNPISVSDIDAGSSPISVTLTATNGTLTLLGTSGLTFSVGDGTADATMTFTGTVTAINAALNGLSFAPTANYNGAASVQITTNDQGNTGLGGAQSDDDTVAITVAAVNDAPMVSTIPNQSASQGVPVGPIAFTVGDVDTPVGNLVLSGGSSNTAVIPNANIVFGGSGANRTVTVTSAANGVGTATITVTVNDGAGGVISTTFDVAVTYRLYLPLVVKAP